MKSVSKIIKRVYKIFIKGSEKPIAVSLMLLITLLTVLVMVLTSCCQVSGPDQEELDMRHNNSIDTTLNKIDDENSITLWMSGNQDDINKYYDQTENILV